jgi:hypothetical protein
MAEAVVDVRIAGMKPVMALVNGAASADGVFRNLDEAVLGSLPADVRVGIGALRAAVENYAAAIPRGPEERDDEERTFWGRVIIEWPAPRLDGSLLAGWGCRIRDAGTGRLINTASEIVIPAVHAAVPQWIECDLLMLADDDGKPILFPDAHADHPGCTLQGERVRVCPDGRGGFKQGTFRFVVAEMRVAASEKHPADFRRCPDCAAPLVVVKSCAQCDAPTAARCPGLLPRDGETRAGGCMIILEFQWEQDGQLRAETFGPWVADEDETYLESATGFIKDWSRLSGHKATSVVMTLVTDPAGWVREREERAETDAAIIGRGIVSAAKISGDYL